MKSLWENPPRTAVEVYRKLPEGTRCEVINNVLYMLPRNRDYHQRVLTDILGSIGEYTRRKNLGDFIPGTDVYLDEFNAVQPDLLFVAADNMKTRQTNGFSLKGKKYKPLPIAKGKIKSPLLKKTFPF